VPDVAPERSKPVDTLPYGARKRVAAHPETPG
jgi:hypothetical protein